MGAEVGVASYGDVGERREFGAASRKGSLHPHLVMHP